MPPSEVVNIYRFPGLVSDNGGRRWLVTWSSTAAKREAVQKRRGRRKEKGEGTLHSAG
jgi:hypothetical protein